jgi:hypothetical protein
MSAREIVLAEDRRFAGDNTSRLIDTGHGIVREITFRTGHAVTGEMGWRTVRQTIKDEAAARKNPEKVLRELVPC